MKLLFAALVFAALAVVPGVSRGGVRREAGVRRRQPVVGFEIGDALLKQFRRQESSRWATVEKAAEEDFGLPGLALRPAARADQAADLRFAKTKAKKEGDPKKMAAVTSAENSQAHLLAAANNAQANADKAEQRAGKLEKAAEDGLAAAGAINVTQPPEEADDEHPFPKLAKPQVDPPVLNETINCNFDTCDVCAGVFGCGWCVTNSKCDMGGYDGPREGAASCPRTTPEKKLDPLDSGVQQNWYVFGEGKKKNGRRRRRTWQVA